MMMQSNSADGYGRSPETACSVVRGEGVRTNAPHDIFSKSSTSLWFKRTSIVGRCFCASVPPVVGEDAHDKQA
jgi:hypothetical protein